MNQTAQGLAALGRGPDTQLVHMAPGEVRSLQQLAMAHGGSLTINPETGLPEAGFLSSLLPMLIGGGLSIASGGALTPLMAAMMTGGGYAAATGSLRKGLMAGLGAYGGAGLGSALAGSGVQAAANTQIAGDAAYKTAQEAMQQQATALGQNALPYTPEGFAAQARDLTAPLNTMRDAALTSQQTAFANASPFAKLQTAGSGISSLGSEAGRNAFMGRAASEGVAATGIGGGKGLMQAGMMAAAPMMMQTTTQQPEIKSDANMGQRYQFNAGTQTPTPTPDVPGYENQGINFGKEQRYFNPTYTPIDKEAARKLYGFAEGGPVEAMSDANSIGMNTGYPQADIRTGAYATPYQQPISRNVVTGPQGAGIDPYTGQQQRIAPAPQAQFAEGGEVGGYTYDPVTQMYVKKGGEGATMVSPTGGISGASGSSGGSDPYSDPNPSWSNMTDREKASYYAENPTMAAITQALQAGFGLTSLGMAQNYFSPETVNTASLNAQGFDRGGGFLAEPSGMSGPQGQTSYQSGIGNPAEQGSDTGGGAGIGGGDISGASADTPALARGGISHLGDYSDGGRLLRGPGDGVSDSIPATIANKRPARLADGEFVVPARIVSELGNGSTEAGARKLYQMLARVQNARKKSIGQGRVAVNSRAEKLLPA